MADSEDLPSRRIAFREAEIGGRKHRYLCGGDGPSVVFLHGWGLTNRTYSRALAELALRGLRVFAPTMPGFGGTPSLPPAEFSLEGYARWVAEFVTALDGPAPVTLIGHSFGGGIAIRTAHDFPGLANRLVLVNSIGGSAWSNGKGALVAMRERPLWDWGLHLQADVLPSRHMTRVLPVILRDAVPNLMRSPGAVWRAAHLARSADLTAELDVLKQRRMPVTIVWSQRDDVIPAATIGSLRAAAGDPVCVTVPGNHGWLLADPRRFGEVITNVVSAPEAVAAAMTEELATETDGPLEAA